MPGKDGDETGYRWEIGTSIAVRLDPRKEGASFQLRSLLEKHVFSSPVPIELDGQPVGHDYASMIEKPWCEPTVVDFLPEGMAQLREFTGYEFTEPLKVVFLPLDLTRHSPTPEFKGQILTAVIRPTEEWRRFQKGIEALGQIQLTGGALRYDNHKQMLSFRFIIYTSDYFDSLKYICNLRDSPPDGRDEAFAGSLLRLIERIKGAYEGNYGQLVAAIPTNAFCEVDAVRVPKTLSSVTQSNILAIEKSPYNLISHNGVVIPPKSVTRADGTFQALPLRPTLALHGALCYQALSWGAIALTDSLRPDVDVSRGSLRRVPLRVYSSAIFSLHRSLKEAGLEEDSRWDIPDFTYMIDKEPPTFGQLIDEKILLPEADWAEVPLFFTYPYWQLLSLRQVKELLDQGGQVRFWHLPDGGTGTQGIERSFGPYCHSFFRICAARSLSSTQPGSPFAGGGTGRLLRLAWRIAGHSARTEVLPAVHLPALQQRCLRESRLRSEPQPSPVAMADRNYPEAGGTVPRYPQSAQVGAGRGHSM